MVKHTIYLEVPKKEGVLDTVKFYAVPIYARGYNLMNMENLISTAKEAVIAEFAYENEELAKHIREKTISNKHSTENSNVDVHIVDVYNIEEKNNLEDIITNYTFF